MAEIHTGMLFLGLDTYTPRQEWVKASEHRLEIARLTGQLKSAQQRDEIGWLIEHRSARPHKWRTWEGGWPDWTTDSTKALRLARREDADNMAAEDPEDVMVTEHIWHSTPPSGGGEHG